MGHLFSDGTTRPATERDLEAYERMRQQQTKQTAPVLQRRDNPHEYLFIALFDGTGQSAYNRRQALTNIGELKVQAEDLRNDPRNRIGVRYIEGIGTQKNPVTRIIDGAFPYTWDDKIRKAYRDLAEQTTQWKRQDPQAEIRVVSVGYSRGAVLVPGLARLIDKFGIVDADGLKFGTDTHGNITVESSRTLVPPGEVAQAVGLFDPVGTNLPKNYDARLPKSVLSGFSQLARDEQRELFPHQTIIDPDWSEDGRFLSATLPGGHSNIGGGNRDAGLESLAFNGMADYLNALTDRSPFTHREVPEDPAQFTIFQATGATAAFGLRMDKDGQRDLRDELANCTIVDICRDAEPMDLALANRFDWQHVTPQRPKAPPQLPETGELTRTVEAPAAPLPAPSPAVVPVIRLDDPIHPDHALYLNAQAHVYDLDRQFNRTPDQRSDNLSAALVVAARADGLQRIDRIELGKDGSTLAIVEAPVGQPEKRSEVPVVASMNTTMARSADQWSIAMHDFEQRQTPSHDVAREASLDSVSPQPLPERLPTSSILGRHDPRHEDHPQHGLYRQLERCVPEASEERLLQFTAACHASRITASNLYDVRINEDRMTIEFIGTGFRTRPALIDLEKAPPFPDQAIEQIQQYDQRQAQILEEVRAQQAQLGRGHSL